jgi:hypothetical protein
MVKSILLFALVCLPAFGQTAYPLSPVMAGIGGGWNRGANYPLQVLASVDYRVASEVYIGLDVSTPVTRNPGSSAPLPSTITAETRYLPACSPTKSACLVLGAAGGFSGATAATPAAPAINGIVAVQFRFGSAIYATVGARASNAAYSPTSGALATAVFSPWATLAFGFPTAAVPPLVPARSPTVKQMRTVMRRLGLPEDVPLRRD